MAYTLHTRAAVRILTRDVIITAFFFLVQAELDSAKAEIKELTQQVSRLKLDKDQAQSAQQDLEVKVQMLERQKKVSQPFCNAESDGVGCWEVACFPRLPLSSSIRWTLGVGCIPCVTVRPIATSLVVKLRLPFPPVPHAPPF